MQKKLIKKIVLVFAVCIAAAGGFFIHSARADGSGYREETAEIRSITVYNSYEGNIESADGQEIYSTSTSTMKKIYVSEGDFVKKGELLFELEDDNASSRVTQAHATVTSAEVSYRDAVSEKLRMKSLYEAGAAARSEYENTQSALETAAAQLTKAKADLETAENDEEDLKGYAEIDGEVNDINVEENDTMLSGTEIMNITNYDHLIVKIKIDEYDLDAVSEGDPAEVKITALNQTVQGTVSQISKKAEIVNGVSYFNAEVSLVSDKALKVGLSAEIRIVSEKAPDAVAISMNALKFDQNNRPYVLIRGNNNQVETRAVTVGINDGSIAEIKSGLHAGDCVLIKKSENEKASSLKLPVPGGRIAENAAQ